MFEKCSDCRTTMFVGFSKGSSKANGYRIECVQCGKNIKQGIPRTEALELWREMNKETIK